MADQKLTTYGRGSNTEPGIAKPVALFHHSHWIVDSSRQSSPDISPKIASNSYGKFWGVDNFSHKLIINTALCCVLGYITHQDIWHQEGSVKNKNTAPSKKTQNTTPCLHALQQRVCTVNWDNIHWFFSSSDLEVVNCSKVMSWNSEITLK